MLILKPNCECCDKDLAPDAPDAMICSFECTFCRTCVDEILNNVCPNCGGGFEARPVRPRTEHRPGVSLTQRPASNERKHLKFTRDDVAAFAERVKNIPPGDHEAPKSSR